MGDSGRRGREGGLFRFGRRIEEVAAGSGEAFPGLGDGGGADGFGVFFHGLEGFRRKLGLELLQCGGVLGRFLGIAYLCEYFS